VGITHFGYSTPTPVKVAEPMTPMAKYRDNSEYRTFYLERNGKYREASGFVGQ